MTVVSPELALIDPELAAEARASLYAPGEFRPARPASRESSPVEILSNAALEPGPEEPRGRPRRRSTRFVLVAGASGVLTAIAFATLSGVADRRPARVVVDAAAVRARAQVEARRDARDARRYEWPAVPGSDAYRLVVLRDGKPVFTQVTTKPSLVMPAHLNLPPGRYTWSATPTSADGVPAPGAEPVAEVTFLVSRAGS